MNRPHYPRRRLRPATGPVTAAEVRDLMAVGLKSEQELHPDFPGDGSSPTHINEKTPAVNADHWAAEKSSEQGVTVGETTPPPDIFNMAHLFHEVERRILGPRK